MIYGKIVAGKWGVKGSVIKREKLKMGKEGALVKNLNYKENKGEAKQEFNESSYEIYFAGEKKKKKCRGEIELFFEVNELTIENLIIDYLFLYIRPFLQEKPINIVLNNVEVKDLIIDGYVFSDDFFYPEINRLTVKNFVGKLCLYSHIKEIKLKNFDSVIFKPHRGRVVNQIKAEHGNSIVFQPSNTFRFTDYLKIKSLKIKNVKRVYIGTEFCSIYNPILLKIINCNHLVIENENILKSLPPNSLIKTEKILYLGENLESFQIFIEKIKEGIIKANKLDVLNEQYLEIKKILKKNISTSDLLKIKCGKIKEILEEWYNFYNNH